MTDLPADLSPWLTVRRHQPLAMAILAIIALTLGLTTPAHATDYGLIVRYPQGGEAITGYDWEAWHVRWVGKDTARAMAATPGITLEEYLGQA